jgi:forkhead protein FKH
MQDVEDDESSLTADQSKSNLTPNEDDRLIAQVTQILQFPKEIHVQASKDHANAIYDANDDGVKAYAKIAAQDWTFYVTKLSINIGRPSEPLHQAQLDDHEGDDDEDFVHIDLGPSKMVSRQHALIYFNSRDERWILQVKGRNGVKLDNALLKQGHSKALRSGEVLDIGGVEMMFVLPPEIVPLQISPIYLQRAGVPRSDHRSPNQISVTKGQSLPKENHVRTQANSCVGQDQPFQPRIAPAPPDYKRPGTPPSASTRSKNAGPQYKSPSYSNTGALLMASSDIDLSQDENRHIKPQFSYAQMITQAIMNTPDERLNLNGIYTFIMNNYSYYKHQQAAGWQVSLIFHSRRSRG